MRWIQSERKRKKKKWGKRGKRRKRGRRRNEIRDWMRVLIRREEPTRVIQGEKIKIKTVEKEEGRRKRMGKK